MPTVVTGSIPPNKSDLKNFGVYTESNADGDFLNLFWSRVQDPSGTTNMDFEFNHNAVCGATGTSVRQRVTPVRTEGDLLIQYDLSNGGTTADHQHARMGWLRVESDADQLEANAARHDQHDRDPGR